MLRAPAWVQQIKSTHSAAQGVSEAKCLHLHAAGIAAFGLNGMRHAAPERAAGVQNDSPCTCNDCTASLPALLPFPTAAQLPLLLERAALPSLDGWPPEARCQVFVAFYQYLLAAVSIVVAAKLHPLLYGARDPEPPRTSLGAPYKLLRSGLHAADARLHHMCAMVWGEQGSALSRLAVAWTLLSFLMQLALLLEMHASLAPTVQLGGT